MSEKPQRSSVTFQMVIAGAQAFDAGLGKLAESILTPVPTIAPETVAESTPEQDKPLGLDDGKHRSRTMLGKYRPFRHRRGPNRAVPSGTKRTADGAKEAPDA